MSFVDDCLQKSKQNIATFCKVFWSVAAWALPIEDHAIRVNLIDRLHESDCGIIFGISLESIDQIGYIEGGASIYLYFGSFYTFLLDGAEEIIVAGAVAEGDNNCNSFLGVVGVTQ